MQKAKLKIEKKTGWAVRFGTHKSAWVRLGPDKFFSSAFAGLRRDKPAQKWREKWVWRLVVSVCKYTTCWGVPLCAALCRFAKGAGHANYKCKIQN
jgi:hypothetical protein